MTAPVGKIKMGLFTKYIWVTFTKEGIHCYPAAATDPTLATGDEYDVSYLASPHRHQFHFKVSLSVTHNDRDVEFIQFKRWLMNQYDSGSLELSHRSCEMMADELLARIISVPKYDNRVVTIDVSEDGENGAHLHYTPQ